MIFQPADAIRTPTGARAIWRYLPHDRFADLLKRSSLYFANASRLTDQYEVTIPDAVLVAKRHSLERQGLSGHALDHALRHFSWAMDPDKKLTLINCWSMRREESYALWKVYLRGEVNGVAVRSTVGRLRRSIEDGGDHFSEPFFIGKVEYRNYVSGGELSRFSIICTKKPYYDFENEVRAFILHDSPSTAGRKLPYDIATGRHVRVDLGALIHRVVVSPFAGHSYSASVASLLKRARLPRTLMKASGIQEREAAA